MDYEKAIEALQFEGGIEITGNPRKAAEFFGGIDVAISAMEELQAIHENGISIEHLKDIDFRKQVVEHINYMEYMDIKDELEEYKQIGTLEEVQEAVEKHRCKKIEIWNGQATCPQCKKLFGNISDIKRLISWEMPYCKFCGQHLDWSEEE